MDAIASQMPWPLILGCVAAVLGFCTLLTAIERRMHRLAETVLPDPRTVKEQRIQTTLAATLILANPMLIWGGVKVAMLI